MKSYRSPDKLRLVGKAWEVRSYLRRLASRSSDMPLAVYLNAGRSREDARSLAGSRVIADRR